MNGDGKNVILTAIPCVTNNLKINCKGSNNNTKLYILFYKVWFRSIIGTEKVYRKLYFIILRYIYIYSIYSRSIIA